MLVLAEIGNPPCPGILVSSDRPVMAPSSQAQHRVGEQSLAATPEIVLQKLWEADRDCLEAHLLRLDPEDRQMRFCAAMSDRAIHRYCRSIDWIMTTVLGCFAGKELRGVAELVVTASGFSARAEVALSVERAFQSRGIGTELLRRTLSIARNRYIGSVHMLCLLDNHKMQHIARKFDAELTIHQGEVEGKIWPPWPTLLSFIEEVAADRRALFSARFPLAQPSPDEDPRSDGFEGL